MKTQITKNAQFTTSVSPYIALEILVAGEISKIEIFAHAFEVATGFAFNTWNIWLPGDDGAGGIQGGPLGNDLTVLAGTISAAFSLSTQLGASPNSVGVQVNNAGNANLIIDVEWIVTRFTP